jgi:hypothetical protein
LFLISADNSFKSICKSIPASKIASAAIEKAGSINPSVDFKPATILLIASKASLYAEYREKVLNSAAVAPVLAAIFIALASAPAIKIYHGCLDNFYSFFKNVLAKPVLLVIFNVDLRRLPANLPTSDTAPKAS